MFVMVGGHPAAAPARDAADAAAERAWLPETAVVDADESAAAEAPAEAAAAETAKAAPSGCESSEDSHEYLLVSWFLVVKARSPGVTLVGQAFSGPHLGFPAPLAAKRPGCQIFSSRHQMMLIPTGVDRWSRPVTGANSAAYAPEKTICDREHLVVAVHGLLTGRTTRPG
ncbi:hypothetical protein AB0L13_36205 [Saccharopolyspora shandongensis]|uniref:hypothetical protein n=1 Tax=Saccharopolyspora shandongensis TaxID=418495 RepID=UPI0034220558